MLEINLYSSKFRSLNKPDHILGIKEIQQFSQSRKHVGHFPEHYEKNWKFAQKKNISFLALPPNFMSM